MVHGWVLYDAEPHVLSLHIGDPSSAVDYDESPEGHALRFDADRGRRRPRQGLSSERCEQFWPERAGANVSTMVS